MLPPRAQDLPPSPSAIEPAARATVGAPGRPRRGVMALAALLAVVALGLAAQAVRSVLGTARTQVVSEPEASPARVGPAPGEIAPPVDVPALEGDGRVRLAALRGHPVVLNFWASWCPPCRAESGVLEAAWTRYRVRGVVVVGIDVQSDALADARAFRRTHGMTCAVGRAYRITGLPTTYFIGADGRVHAPPAVGGFLGPAGARDLAQQIDAMLAQQQTMR